MLKMNGWIYIQFAAIIFRHGNSGVDNVGLCPPCLPCREAPLIFFLPRQHLVKTLVTPTPGKLMTFPSAPAVLCVNASHPKLKEGERGKHCACKTTACYHDDVSI